MNELLSPLEIADYTDALRSLARALVRDTAAADDAVQDTLAQALRTPPRRGPTAGAWFRTVLRNTVRRHARTNARRRARESTAGNPTPSVAPEAREERMEVAQALIDAIRALPDVQREAVEMRYFEDLTPTEIATRLQLPVQTVKTRLKRALQKLRASLARERGVNWKATVSLAFGLGRATPLIPQVVAPALAVVLIAVLAGAVSGVWRTEQDEESVESETSAGVFSARPRLEGSKSPAPEEIASDEPEEPAGLRMFGSAVLVHPDGSETQAQSGLLLLTLSHRAGVTDKDGLRRVAIEDGQWSLESPRGTPARDEPKSFMPAAVLQGERVAIGMSRGRVPARVGDAGGPHVLRFRSIPETVVHVVDARTGEELPGTRIGFIDPAVDGALIPSGGLDALEASPSGSPIEATQLIAQYIRSMKRDFQRLTLHGDMPTRVHVPGRGWHRWNIRLGGEVYLPVPDAAVGSARFDLLGRPSLWFELRRDSAYGEVVRVGTITSSERYEVAGLPAGPYHAEVFALEEGRRPDPGSSDLGLRGVGRVRQVHAHTSFRIEEPGQVVSRTLTAQESLPWIQVRGTLRIAREWATTNVRTSRLWRQHLRKDGLPPVTRSPWGNLKELVLTVRGHGVPARVFRFRPGGPEARGAGGGGRETLAPIEGEPGAWTFDMGRALPGEYDFLIRCVGRDWDLDEASMSQLVGVENAGQVEVMVPPPRRVRLRLANDGEELNGRKPVRTLRWRPAWASGFNSLYRTVEREPFEIVTTSDAIVVGLSYGIDVEVQPVALDLAALEPDQVHTLRIRSPCVMGLKVHGVNVGCDFVAHWVDFTHIADDGVETEVTLDSQLQPGCRAIELEPLSWGGGTFVVRLWAVGRYRVSVSRHPALRHVPDQEIEIRGPYYSRNMVEFRR